MIRFATIGTNFVVEWFLKCAAQVEGLQYNGTYSRNIEKAEKFAKEHNGNLIFGNLEELANTSVRLEIDTGFCPYKGNDFQIEVAKRNSPSSLVYL